MTSLRTPAFLLSLATLASCASTRIPGQYARVSVASGFSPATVHTIGVLPLTLEGKPGEHTDHLTSDRLAARLLDLGFRVIDPSQLEAKAREKQIDLQQSLRDEDIQQLGRTLNVDALVTGTVSWNYIPAHSESSTNLIHTTHTEIKTSKDKDGRTRNDTTVIHDDVPAVQSSSSEGVYVTVGENIKILSVSDGAILISGYAPNGRYDMTDEIVDAIKQRLFPPAPGQ